MLPLDAAPLAWVLRVALRPTGATANDGPGTGSREPMDTGAGVNERRVGVATHEQLVVDAVVNSSAALLRPSRGFRTYALQEVELGVGRPDALFLVASPAAVKAARTSRPRLANLTEAEVLAASAEGRASRHTASHQRAVEKRLGDAGWTPELATRLLRRPLVRHSLLVEAKVKDWRSGLIQIGRERWAASLAALAVPRGIESRVDRQALRRSGAGLIVAGGSGADWKRRAEQRALPPHAQLWLGELLLRSVEEEG